MSAKITILTKNNENLFKLIQDIEKLEIIKSKIEILDFIDLTLTLSTNDKNLFKIMNVSFNAMELFNNFEFITTSDNCKIKSSISNWILFVKTILNTWTYDSNLLAMFIIKISDFLNNEYLKYCKENSINPVIDIYKEYFNIDKIQYQKLNNLCSNLNKIIGTVSFLDLEIIYKEYDMKKLEINELIKIIYKINNQFKKEYCSIKNNNLLILLKK